VSILVINAGSSSVKFGLYGADAHTVCATGLIDWTANAAHTDLVLQPRDGSAIRSPCPSGAHSAVVLHAIRAIVQANLAPPVEVVGHRVVHGGAVFRGSVRIDAGVRTELERLSELAPLHNPPALEAIGAAETALPGVSQVAAFDTAFFADLPPRAYVYPLPYEWYTSWGIRRFGFHGISHAYCTGRAAELLGRPAAALRLVICHLGNGCSASAVQGGRAIATTMGFTPMEGLMMGTRCGSVDPGVLLHVLRKCGMDAEQLDDALNHSSGLLGVSGVSSDFRQVEAAAQKGDERARLALDIYADRVRATIGALAVTLGGVDALVFTAGVGEHAKQLRAAACAGLECVGLRLDAARNQDCKADCDIAAADSPSRILVIHTEEERLIAREARRLAPSSTRAT
jgi:acetate kinase